MIQKQRKLQIIERKIDNRLQQLADALSSELDVIRMTEIPPRRIAWIRNQLSPKTYLDLETSIRELEQDQKDAVVFLGKVGVGIGRERLLEKAYERYDMVFCCWMRRMSTAVRRRSCLRKKCVTVRFCGEPQRRSRILSKA